MHTLTLSLTTTSYDRKELERRLFAIWHVHNTLVRHARKQLGKLRRDKEYRELLELYHQYKGKDAFAVQFRKIKDQLDGLRETYGLTEAQMQKYAAVMGPRFKKLISSQQIQKEASRVYAGVEDVLFSDGKDLHFKKFTEQSTISGKSPTNGIRYYDKDHKDSYPKSVKPVFDHEIEYLGLHIRVKVPDADYVKASLASQISYCEIKRLEFNSGYRYYVILYLKGPAPKMREAGSEKCGVDPGVSTMALVADSAVFLEELAPDVDKYTDRIEQLQQAIDASTRASNPGNYNSDGTIKKGKKTWVNSKTCIRSKRKVRVLYRKRSAYIRQSHEKTINQVIRYCGAGTVNCEKMDYKALQKRAKQTKRKDTPSVVKNKKGEEKTVYKYEKKKRFGHSIQERAPSMFLSLLKNKVEQYGGTFQFVDTKTFKASQYRHDTDTYKKEKLSTRSKIVSHRRVQRDLYSGFLIKNADKTLKHADREKCIREFEKFMKLHDAKIKEMKEKHISNPNFGF